MNKKQQLQLIWRHTHPDFRGIINGIPSVLTLRDGGTTLVGIDCLTDREIEAKLICAVQLEARRLAKRSAETHRNEDRMGFGLEPAEQAP